MSWSVQHLTYRPTPEAPHTLRDATLEVPAGQFTAILGPNGAGKSTLLHLLLGTRKPESGTVQFCDRDIAQWKRAELAKRIGVVAQSEVFAFPLSVRDMIAMGRYPHLGRWRQESETDRAAVAKAMELCDIVRFQDRDVMSLSGGELQRVRVARALAQEPDTLALDEPTAALDISHEMATFELLKELRSSGMTVLLITHHINLAARYADRLIVLHDGHVAASGPPQDVLTSYLVEQVWRWPVVITSHPGSGHDAGAVQVTPLAQTHAQPLGMPPTSPDEFSAQTSTDIAGGTHLSTGSYQLASYE